MSQQNERPFLLVIAGEIGEQVAHLLAEEGLIPAAKASVADFAAEGDALWARFFAETHFQAAAFAFARPYPDILRSFDRFAYKKQIPWTYGQLDERVVQIGPTVIPPETASYDSFVRRYAVNSPLSHIDVALMDFYSHNDATFDGRFAPLDNLTAGLLALEIARLVRRQETFSKGTYWYFDPLSDLSGKHAIAKVPWSPVDTPPASAKEWSYQHLAESWPANLLLS